MSKLLYGSLIAASLVAAMTMAPLMASAVSTIVQAQVEKDNSKLQAELETASKIVKNGSQGAFGYAVFTSNGDGSLIVATTHKGVCDSSSQSTIPTLHFDPGCSAVWHTHYVNLVTAGTDCAPNAALGGARLEVANLSYQKPGKLDVQDENIDFINMPGSFSGTNAVTGTGFTWAPTATPAGLVASFTLAVNGGHVCVENVAPFNAEKQ